MQEFRDTVVGEQGLFHFKSCGVCGSASLTIMAPGHVDTVKPTVWFIDPIFSTKNGQTTL